MTVVLIDMDEVLADFTGAALQAHGWTQERFMNISRGQGYGMHRFMDLKLWKFWQPIHELGTKFWIDIKPLPWIDDVIYLVDEWCDKHGHQWIIATTPTRAMSSRIGKERWLKNYFGQSFTRYEIVFDKRLMARSDTIIIDDREDTVKEFMQWSQGILFPSWHNRLHECNDPVPYLKQQLENLNAL